MQDPQHLAQLLQHALRSGDMDDMVRGIAKNCRQVQHLAWATCFLTGNSLAEQRAGSSAVVLISSDILDWLV